MKPDLFSQGMKNPKAVVGIVAVGLTASAWLSYRAWIRPVSPVPIREVGAPASRQRIEMDQKATAMVEDWNQATVVPIISDEMRRYVSSMGAEGCISAPQGARPLKLNELAEAQVDDLRTAIGDMLIAYASGEPDDFFNYMRGRGTTLSPAVRTQMIAFLKKKGQADVETAADSVLFASQWKAFSAGAHWQNLVVEPTCLHVWDGCDLKANDIQQIALDRYGDPSGPGALLDDAMQSNTSKTTSFVPAVGSVDAELSAGEGVIVADLRLVVGYDARLHELKAANLCRFWFNRQEQKWQPICLVIFGTSPGPKYFPLVLF